VGLVLVLHSLAPLAGAQAAFYTNWVCHTQRKNHTRTLLTRFPASGWSNVLHL